MRGADCGRRDIRRPPGFALHRLQKPPRIELGVSSHWAETLSYLSLYLWGPAHSKGSVNFAGLKTKPYKKKMEMGTDLSGGKTAPSPLSSCLSLWWPLPGLVKVKRSAKLQFSKDFQQLRLGFMSLCEDLLHFTLWVSMHNIKVFLLLPKYGKNIKHIFKKKSKPCLCHRTDLIFAFPI